MQHIAELITIGMAMMTSGERRHMMTTNAWQKLVAATLMTVIGASGGIAGAFLVIKIDNAIIMTKLENIERQIQTNAQNFRQHELERSIHLYGRQP